jgi:hypothetical protein
MSIKIPFSLSGIELAAFRLVAQCLEELRHHQRVPLYCSTTGKWEMAGKIKYINQTQVILVPGRNTIRVRGVTAGTVTA